MFTVRPNWPSPFNVNYLLILYCKKSLLSFAESYSVIITGMSLPEFFSHCRNIIPVNMVITGTSYCHYRNNLFHLNALYSFIWKSYALTIFMLIDNIHASWCAKCCCLMKYHFQFIASNKKYIYIDVCVKYSGN